MIRTGEVVGVENGIVKVCFSRPEMCEKCNDCMGGPRKEVFSIKGEARIGDEVDVQMPDVKILKASAIVFIIPLLCLLGGIAIGQFVFQSDTYAILIGLLFLSLSLVTIHIVDKALGKKESWRPKIVANRPSSQTQEM